MGLLRLLLALSVVATHCGPIFGSRLVSGNIAVQSFYIISGFYMSLILNEKYIGENSSFSLFITNRFIRLFPIYWAVLLISIIICIGVVVATKGKSIPKFDSYLSVKTNVLSFLFLVTSNLILFGQDIIMFLGINPANGNLYFTSNFANTHPPLHSFLFIPQAWTLGLELTFYLMAPYLLKKGNKVIIPIIGISFLLRIFIYNVLGFKNDPWTYRFFPTEIMFFLMGYFSYRLLLKFKNISVSRTINIIIVLVMVLFTIFYQYLPSTNISYSSFSTIDAIYFLLVTLTLPILFNFCKNSRLDNQIGELSYPVYISHMLVIEVCTKLPSLVFKSGWFITLITLIFAYCLNIIIAKPLEKYRQARMRKRLVT